MRLSTCSIVEHVKRRNTLVSVVDGRTSVVNGTVTQSAPAVNEPIPPPSQLVSGETTPLISAVDGRSTDNDDVARNDKGELIEVGRGGEIEAEAPPAPGAQNGRGGYGATLTGSPKGN